jgi:CHAT domain-containing protein
MVRLVWFLCRVFVTTFVITVIASGAHAGLTASPTASPISAQQQIVVESSKAGNSTTPTGDLIATGKRFYAAGELVQAAQTWRQAADDFQRRGNPWNQALSLSYVSLAEQDLGNWSAAQAAIAQALSLLHTHATPQSRPILAQALTTQGSLQLALGQPTQALDTWQAAEQLYRELGDDAGRLGCQINQAQALQSLGFYRRAQTLLTEVNQRLQTAPTSALTLAGLRSLGQGWQAVGNLAEATTALQKALAIAQQLQQPRDLSATLLSLGNLYRAQQQPSLALDHYRQAAATAPTALARLEAEVNAFTLLGNRQPALNPEAQNQLPSLQAQLAQLTPSRPSIYLHINLANRLMHQRSVSAALLTHAIQQARRIHDTRAESAALGQLGQLYEQNQQWTEAQQLTQSALALAQASNATDIAYRWQWQLGRLRLQLGDRPGAIAAYTDAVNSLKTLRRDLITMSPTLQFSFREQVEPVYREWVRLLVTSGGDGDGTGNGSGNGPSQAQLQQAREGIEALQLAELEDFFRAACLNARPSQIDQLDPTAAIVYPILLRDRLSVILSVPGQPLTVYHTLQPQAQLEATLERMEQSLSPVFGDQERLRVAQQVYDWLIRPALPTLRAAAPLPTRPPIQTLVFVLDGRLRNLPMAALHDGQRYLVEEYSVAIAPSLQLLQPANLEPAAQNVLIGGLTEARQGFAALPGVATESQQIAANVKANVLLDQHFTQGNLQAQVQKSSFPIVHLATHGQFSSNLEKTFILTWDTRMSIDGLRTLLQSRSPTLNPIELLVLSACETAEGDKQAALGLAGLAVRTGAKSTLASLWSVNDTSTSQFMAEFYQALAKQGMSKAAALRQAQLGLLRDPRYHQPFYWAPFILVGNWL